MAKTVLVESKPAITKVGTAGTPLEYYVQTQYQVDDNGKLITGSTKSFITYNNSTIPGVKNFVQAAETSNGGASWTFKNGLDGKPIFGADAQKSLKQGALRTDTQNAIVSSVKSAAQPLSKEDQKQVATSTKNDSNETGQEPITATDIEKSLDLKEGTRYKKGDFREDLRYPSDLQVRHQDVIQFSMLRYSPRTFNAANETSIGGFGERRDYSLKDYVSRIIGKVTLPIPGGISDTNAVNWGSDSMNPFQAALANIALTGIREGGEAAAQKGSELLTNISKNSSDVQTALAAGFAQAATGTAEILSRTQGAVLNPNMELLFTGPTLRPFNFTFKLSARGEKDREQIRQIIRFFKQGMAAQRTASQLFLKAPNTFKIQYLHKNKDHPYINLIKECALQSFTVNYTPEGNYMTFADGLMTSYEITMQFQELEPVFNDDYTQFEKDNNLSRDAVIGY